MTPFVVSSDVTTEEAYAGAPLGHPWIRQPLIFAHVGLDHLRTGSALGARLRSVCRHVELTYHRGMPVFDLQVIQTHERGLDVLRDSMEELLEDRTARARRQNRTASWILADRKRYYHQFLGPDGYIARAARFDYPTPADEGSVCPPEFFSLPGLMTYAAGLDPERPPLRELPGRALALLRRRVDSGRTMGWFG